MTLVKKHLILPKLSGYLAFIGVFTFFLFSGISPYSLFVMMFLTITIVVLMYVRTTKMNLFYRSTAVKDTVIIQAQYISTSIFSISIILYQLLFMQWNTLFKYNLEFYFYTWKDIIIVFCMSILLISYIIPIYHLVQSVYTFGFTLMITLFVGIIMIENSIKKLVGSMDQYFYDLEMSYLSFVNKYVPGQPYVTLVITSLLLLIGSYFLSLYLFKKKDLV